MFFKAIRSFHDSIIQFFTIYHVPSKKQCEVLDFCVSEMYYWWQGEPSFHLYGFIMCISATAARAFKSVLQGILLSSEGYILLLFSYRIDIADFVEKAFSEFDLQ